MDDAVTQALVEATNGITDPQFIRFGLTRSLIEFAAYCKDPAFAEEKEWRFFTIDLTARVKTRATTGGVIPYSEFKVPLGVNDELPLFAITVGPGGDVDKALALEYLLGEREDVPVTLSKVPYRGK